MPNTRWEIAQLLIRISARVTSTVCPPWGCPSSVSPLALPFLFPCRNINGMSCSSDTHKQNDCNRLPNKQNEGFNFPRETS
uniref:Uncharacterized protein n=1 Tax=Solanum tuberosum TaxID=4113 RepID=M1BSZ9_SOLTU